MDFVRQNPYLAEDWRASLERTFIIHLLYLASGAEVFSYDKERGDTNTESVEK